MSTAERKKKGRPAGLMNLFPPDEGGSSHGASAAAAGTAASSAANSAAGSSAPSAGLASSGGSSAVETPTSRLPQLSPRDHLAHLRQLAMTLEGEAKVKLDLFIFNKTRLLRANGGKLDNSCLDRLKRLYSGDGREVWVVSHRATGLILALKVITYDGRAETCETISRELDLLHECHSPYVVGFYGAFMSGDNREANILTEFMDGGCLDDLLARVGRVPENVLVIIARSILLGLEYLKSKNILHRDIKPSNVLVNSRGEVKLCDFGISRRIRSENFAARTFVGTVRYMSPERLKGDEYNVMSDVWSLGIALIEMATGMYPYLNPTGQVAPVRKPRKRQSIMPTPAAPATETKKIPFFEVFEMVVRGAPPTLPDTPEQLFSPAFRDFVNSCVGSEPSDRLPLGKPLTHPWLATYAEIYRSFDFPDWVRKTHPPGMEFTCPPDE